MVHLFSATFSLGFVAVARISKEDDVGLNQNKLDFHRRKGHFYLKRCHPEFCVIEKEDMSDWKGLISMTQGSGII